jgi:hypothetical protein
MEVMIDIETLSTQKNAVILTIGAMKFDRYNENKTIEELEKFYCRINKDSCIKLGMAIDEETQKWWETQNHEAKYEALLNPDRIDIKIALNKFKLFLSNVKCVWANSPNFDCTILENAFKVCNIEVPWKFWNLRDCRTIYDLGKVNLKSINNNNKHDAISDCYSQILCVQKCIKNLNLKP